MIIRSYRKAQADMRQAVAVKANIDYLLGHTDGGKIRFKSVSQGNRRIAPGLCQQLQNVLKSDVKYLSKKLGDDKIDSKFVVKKTYIGEEKLSCTTFYCLQRMLW